MINQLPTPCFYPLAANLLVGRDQAWRAAATEYYVAGTTLLQATGWLAKPAPVEGAIDLARQRPNAFFQQRYEAARRKLLSLWAPSPRALAGQVRLVAEELGLPDPMYHPNHDDGPKVEVAMSHIFMGAMCLDQFHVASFQKARVARGEIPPAGRKQRNKCAVTA